MISTAARAKELFLELLDLEPDERARRRAALAADEPELSQRVERLVAAHVWVEEVGTVGAGFATPGADSLFASAPLPGDPRPGDVIAGYALVRELGSGGFGTVWKAEQSEPVRRDVALKVVRAGLDSREVHARFQAERQALALMEHPSIARVFDGGATEQGRPWFAMELVDGPPITHYCEQHRLSTQERLELFHAVCLAVRHAHQKGVLHRDLKPSNVLVAEVDGRPVPKVIDFGISKLLDGDDEAAGDRTQLTRRGQLIGTPAYMSPEQVRGSRDVDTRADVYALGVLLYELLVGEVPFHHAETDAGEPPSVHEFQRRILEEEPARPSLGLRRRERPGGTARTTTGVHGRHVRGDLDWIVLCCLEKDRERRYGSAAALAADVERHLAGEPVFAGPPTVGYRLSKFARRNRGLLAGVAAVFLALFAGLVVALDQADRAREAETVARNAAAQAEAKLVHARAASGLLEHVLLSIAPEEARTLDTALVVQLLDRASKNADEWSEGLPVVEADLRRILGGARYSLGAYEEAEPELVRALELREAELGPAHLATLRSRAELGGLYAAWGEQTEALPHLEAALAGLARLEQAGELEGDDLDLVWTVRSNLGTTLRETGRLEEALVLLERVEQHRSETLGPLHDATLMAVNNRATVLDELGRDEEALELYGRNLAIHLDTQGATHPHTLAALNNVAGMLRELGRDEEALPLLEQALDAKRAVLPEGHPSLVVALNNTAQAYGRAGRHDEAQELFAEGYEMARVAQGEGGSQTLVVLFNWASERFDAGEHEEAESLLGELLAQFEPRPEPAPKLLLLAESLLANTLAQQGRGVEAEQYARAAIAAAERALAADDPLQSGLRLRLALALAVQERWEEAARTLDETEALVGASGDAKSSERLERARAAYKELRGESGGSAD